MGGNRTDAWLWICAVVLAVGCASPRPPVVAPAPSSVPASAPTPVPVAGSVPTTRAAVDQAAAAPLPPPLPPVPLVEGPLAIKVVYPAGGQQLTARDSNFILGSTGNGHAQLTINGVTVPVLPNGAFLGWLAIPPGARPVYDLVATNGADRAMLSREVLALAPPRPVSDSIVLARARITELDPSVRHYARLAAASDQPANDTDAVSILRPTPGGTYKWFLMPGTVVQVTATKGDGTSRIRLDGELDAWTETKNLSALDPSAPAPRRTTGNARVTAADGYSDLRVPIGDRPAYLVSLTRDAIALTLYGVSSNTDIVNFATTDPSIRDVTWEQQNTDRVRYTVQLRHPPVGYLVFWDRNAIVLRVRHMPAINPDRPLAGRTIVIDPGHPPIGATGPLGTYEGDIVLQVAEELKPLLESSGATVVMTRTTRAPVGLNERPVTARRANGDAFVSIHLNAHPDGVNPYRTNGSGTYFFLDQSEPLARAVQRGLVANMGLRDLGINYDNLAVARQTWMPAILCEGAFVIVPEQEAALRTVEFRRRYAVGIADGLVEYFRALGAGR